MIFEKRAHAIRRLREKSNPEAQDTIEIAIFKDTAPVVLNQEKRIDQGQTYEMDVIWGAWRDIPYAEPTMLYLYVNGQKYTTCMFDTGKQIACFETPITCSAFPDLCCWEKGNGFDIMLYSPIMDENDTMRFLYGNVPVPKRKKLPLEFYAPPPNIKYTFISSEEYDSDRTSAFPHRYP